MTSVSIVTYRTPSAELHHILGILSRAQLHGITIVDNSSDERIASICSDYPKVKYIPSDNRGYGAGHNIAMRTSLANPQVTYHLVMNSDLDFGADILNRLESWMDCHPDVALLHPRLLNPDGSEQYTARLLPTPFDLLLRRFLPSWVCPRHRKRYLMADVAHTDAFEAGYVQGSFMFMRCASLRKTGLFDERFFMYPEDIDLSRRIRTAGRVVCLPSATVVHDHRAASYLNWRMLGIHMLNISRYFNKWGWLRDAERKSVNRSLGEH